jgi:hypothetical protein
MDKSCATPRGKCRETLSLRPLCPWWFRWVQVVWVYPGRGTDILRLCLYSVHSYRAWSRKFTWEWAILTRTTPTNSLTSSPMRSSAGEMSTLMNAVSRPENKNTNLTQSYHWPWWRSHRPRFRRWRHHLDSKKGSIWRWGHPNPILWDYTMRTKTQKKKNFSQSRRSATDTTEQSFRMRRIRSHPHEKDSSTN